MGVPRIAAFISGLRSTSPTPPTSVPAPARGHCVRVCARLPPTRRAGSPSEQQFLPPPLQVGRPHAPPLTRRDTQSRSGTVSGSHHEQVRHSQSQRPLQVKVTREGRQGAPSVRHPDRWSADRPRRQVGHFARQPRSSQPRRRRHAGRWCCGNFPKEERFAAAFQDKEEKVQTQRVRTWRTRRRRRRGVLPSDWWTGQFLQSKVTLTSVNHNFFSSRWNAHNWENVCSFFACCVVVYMPCE